MIWRLGLRYELSDDVMAYFTYSTGFRSGGFSPRATTAEVLATGQDPEKLTNYELGWKSRWFDDRLQLNGAVFHMIYDDMQIETSIPGGPSGQQQAVANVGKAEINGAELDVVALLTDQWTLSGNLGVLDADYKEFFTDLYSTRTPADYTHLHLRRAPKLTYAIASTYRVSVPTGNVALRVSYDWRDDYEGTLNNHPGTQVKSFGLLNASIVYDHGSNWSVSAYGNNLTNEDSFTHTFVVAPTPQGGSFWKFANPRAPRTYGMEVVYRFGE